MIQIVGAGTIVVWTAMTRDSISNELDSTLTHARDAHEREDYVEEISFLKQALRLSANKKDTAAIYEMIGTSYYLMERREEAKQSYILALENLSSLPEGETEDLVWLLNDYLGGIYFDERDYEKALSHKLKAFEWIEHLRHKDAFLLLIAIGVNCEKLENYDEAIDYYLKATAVPGISDEDKAMVFQFLGQCYDNKGDEKRAFDYFDKMFSIDSEYDGGWYLAFRYAQLAYRFRQYKISIDFFRKVIAQIPSGEKSYLQSAHQCLGYSYIEKRDYKLAVTEFKNALSIETKSSKARAEDYCGMAHAYFGLDKIGKTIKWGLKALDEECDESVLERAYYLLALSYSMFGINKNKKKMRFYTDKLRALKPDSAYLRELGLNLGSNL